MRFSLPLPLRAILLGLLGVVIAILAIVVVILHATPPGQKPENFLPSDTTLAVFHNTAAGSLSAFVDVFPALKTFPLPVQGERSDLTDGTTLAILALQDSSQEWILFKKGEFPAFAGWSALPQRTFGPFHAIASKTEAFSPLEDTRNRLARSPDFRNIDYALSTEALPWFYMKTATLLQKTTSKTILDPLFVTALKSASALGGASIDENTWTLAFKENASLNTKRMSRSITLKTCSPSLVLTASDPNQALQSLLDAQTTNDNRSILQGRVEKLIAKLFGDDVSLRYDLMPLLAGQTVFELSTGSGGRADFVLRGEAKDNSTLENALTHLKQSYATIAPEIEIERHAFEQGFSATVVRPVSAKTLYSETHGNTFIVSNREDLLGPKTESGSTSCVSTLSLPGDDPNASFLTGGHITAKNLEVFFGSSPLTEPLATLLPMHTFTPESALEWSIAQKGSLLVITLKR